jgi:hypothetical protein
MERWQKEEEEILRKLYPAVDNGTIARILKRSIASIENKASRMGLKKATRRRVGEMEKEAEDFVNRFEMMSREEAKKLDQIDLLRLVWSLAMMYKRELNNEGLTKAERHKLMNAFSSHLATLNNAMRGRERISETEEDLRGLFVECVLEGDEGARPRRVYLPVTRRVRLR